MGHPIGGTFHSAACRQRLEDSLRAAGDRRVEAADRRFAEQAAEATSEQRDGLREEGLTLPERLNTRAARNAVSKIAKLKIDRTEFDRQAKALRETNTVYHDTI